MSYKLTASIWQEEDQYVSLCPELGVSSFGASHIEALEMLKEAVELYIMNAEDVEIPPTIQFITID